MGTNREWNQVQETIDRSRQAVMNSLELARRNSERKQVLERRMQAFMQRYDDPQFKENKPLAEIQSNPPPEPEKSSSLQYDLERLRAELQHEREWRTHFLDSEQALKQKVDQQDSRIAQLEAQLFEQTEARTKLAEEKEHLIQLNQSLTATLEQTRGELGEMQYMSTLHKELSLQRRAQVVPPASSEETNNESFSLAMRIRSQRIEELEELFRATSGKYEEMKKQVTAPKKFHRKEELTDPGPSLPSANQSFRSYSIRVGSVASSKRRKPK